MPAIRRGGGVLGVGNSFESLGKNFLSDRKDKVLSREIVIIIAHQVTQNGYTDALVTKSTTETTDPS